jgi:hypothetical protein
MIYADETPMKMKYENGYAWVFTNDNGVVFKYQPTREAPFLNEYLDGFKGVLISDFYLGYDSTKCSHQKCLIHLMRDMNDALLKNPFDTQYKSITMKFTSLLQEIVAEIDRYGLKKRNMNTFKKKATMFFSYVRKTEFSSEASVTLRKRILRN